MYMYFHNIGENSHLHYTHVFEIAQLSKIKCTEVTDQNLECHKAKTVCRINTKLLVMDMHLTVSFYLLRNGLHSFQIQLRYTDIMDGILQVYSHVMKQSSAI